MSSDPESLRLALVGCGGIAGAWLDAVPKVAGVHLATVVEPDPERRRLAADRTGVPVHAGLEPVLEGNTEAALVLTPPSRHAETAVRLLEAGLHVLCEKPLATTVADTRIMLAAAERSERVLMLGSKFRYVSDLAEARALLRSETIGSVVLYENAFCSPVDMTARWNGVRALAGGGVLMDNGSHSADIARFLLGPVARVTARFGPRLQDLEVEDTARVVFETAGGVPGLVDLSWSVRRRDPYYVRLLGSRGCIEIGWRGSRMRVQGDTSWRELGSGYDKGAAFATQLADFARAVRGMPARIEAADALAAVAFVESAYRAEAERTWVEVEP